MKFFLVQRVVGLNQVLIGLLRNFGSENYYEVEIKGEGSFGKMGHRDWYLETGLLNNWFKIVGMIFGEKISTKMRVLEMLRDGYCCVSGTDDYFLYGTNGHFDVLRTRID